MKERATLEDIALIAGVSMMTVSRAINNKPGVSKDLRMQILAIAKSMDYQPNQIARGLATRQTYTIGLVVPDITNPFFAQIARGVEDAAYEHHYNVFLINTAEDQDREKTALDSLWQKNIDGAVLCSPRLRKDQLEKRIRNFKAVVLLNRELQDPLPNLVTLNINDHHGAQIAVHHFLEHQRKNIGYVAGPRQSISSQRRLEGFRNALVTSNLPFDNQMVAHCFPTTEGGYEACSILLKRIPSLDAIFAFNDLVAVGVMQACQALGRRVPEDVAVIGADDIPLASIIRPKLSSLHVNLAYIGKLALRTLLEIAGNENPPSAIQIEPELILRESC